MERKWSGASLRQQPSNSETKHTKCVINSATQPEGHNNDGYQSNPSPQYKVTALPIILHYSDLK